VYVSSANRSSKQDLPTPESPIRRSLNKKSYSWFIFAYSAGEIEGEQGERMVSDNWQSQR